MAQIDLDDALWTRFLALCRELDITDPTRYLEQWIRRGIRLQGAADGRYWPVACALVTRGPDEVLLTGNEYVKGQPLVWNLPGGAVEPGEDLHGAVRRELAEECGLEALRVGRLAWVVQVDYGAGQTGLLSFTFEVPEWRGQLRPEHADTDGLVRAAKFVAGSEAAGQIIPGNARPLEDWLAAAGDRPRMYWYSRDAGADGPRFLDGGTGSVGAMIGRNREELQDRD